MNWETENKQLVKEFTWKNFQEALAFVNEVGRLAEEMNHHPDILLFAYKKVRISLTTHSAGEITELDYKLAEKIDHIQL